MSPVLHEAALVEHQDPIEVSDGGQSMGNHQYGFLAHDLVETFLDQSFGFRVQAGSGFVHD